MKLVDALAAFEIAQRRDSDSWPEDFQCPAGCSRCCEQTPALAVTAAEAELAAGAIRDLPSGMHSKVRARIAALSASPDHAAPCPLLEDHRCTIYGARPLPCRAFGFAAESTERGNSYYGCDVLLPVLQRAGGFALPSFDEAKKLISPEKVIDRHGRELPQCGVLVELLDRLLDP